MNDDFVRIGDIENTLNKAYYKGFTVKSVDDVPKTVSHDVIESRVLKGRMDFITVLVRYICYCILHTLGFAMNKILLNSKDHLINFVAM